jgi:hypothetical protein
LRVKIALNLGAAVLVYPLVGLLALIVAQWLRIPGWTSSDGAGPLVVLLFVVPAVLTATTAAASRVRLTTSAQLVFGTLVASFALLAVLLVIVSSSGALS